MGWAGALYGLGQLLELGGQGLELTNKKTALAFGDQSGHRVSTS